MESTTTDLTTFSVDELRHMLRNPGYRGCAGAWEGIIKHNGQVIWACGHKHRNREMSSSLRPSATSCATRAAMDALRAKNREGR